MKKGFLTILTVILATLASASTRVNLDSLYRVLDAAIDSSAIYQRQKTDAIDALKLQLKASANDAEKYQFAMSLFKAYVAYVNDSALSYLQTSIDLAQRMGRKDLEAQSELALAYQLADTGFYAEAEIHFRAIPKEFLKGDLLLTYLSGRNHLYGEMGYYSHDKRLSAQFHEKANSIRDSLLTLYPEDSRSYVALKSMILNNQDKPDEALPYSDKWRDIVKPNTRAYAIMSFYRSEIYKKKGDLDMQRYWLIQSALTDVRTATMDQASLWSLANSLMREEGDLDRAYRYMDFSWNCISKFSTHMRSWLVSPILTLINDKYKERLHTANNRLMWAVGLISLLALSLLLLFLSVSKKRRQLAQARNDLKLSNDHLLKVNDQLRALNGQLSSLNSHLHDSNRVKEEYITKFLGLCSGYIDKMEAYRIKINRKAKANQFNDILKMTSSTDMRAEEQKELVVNFDTVFLHLFPTFIDDFNALLRPESQVSLNEDGSMSTDLRIFALIRLGLEESSRIAEFLGYSPNSIYNYRARMKNKAAGNRDDFERQVKEIGITE